MESDPAIKLLMRMKKEYLRYKAMDYGLDTKGTKLALATAIAEYERKKFDHTWASIAGRR